MNGEGALAALSFYQLERRRNMNHNQYPTTNDERLLAEEEARRLLMGRVTFSTTNDAAATLATPIETLKVQPAGSVGDINSDAKGSGARFNSGKPELDLIPFRIIAASYGFAGDQKDAAMDIEGVLSCLGQFQETHDEKHLYAALLNLGPLQETWTSCARVFAYGKKKYAAWNWAKGMAWSIPLACAGRHLTFGILAGELVDPESNELHKGHVACNIVMLLTYLRTFPEGNDLPKVLA